MQVQGYSFKHCSELDRIVQNISNKSLDANDVDERSIIEDGLSDAMLQFFWQGDVSKKESADRIGKHFLGEYLLFAGRSLSDVDSGVVQWSGDKGGRDQEPVDGLVGSGVEAGDWREALAVDGRKYYW
jgi:hypothetical protein